MPSSLVTNAGQQSSITVPRSMATILAALPATLPPVLNSTVPDKGLLFGKLVSASVNNGAAKNVVDGSAQTYWDAGEATSSWLSIDTEADNTSYTSVVLAFGKVNGGAESYIRSGISYQIQTSTDSTNWITRATSTSTQAINQHYFTAAGRYLRIHVTGSSGQSFGILRVKAYGNISSIPSWTTEFTYPGWISNDRYPRYLGDVNGDGKFDIVGFREGNTVVRLADPAAP